MIRLKSDTVSASRNENIEREATEGFGSDRTPRGGATLCRRCDGLESSDELCLVCHMKVFG